MRAEIDQQCTRLKKFYANKYAFVSGAEMSDITWAIWVKQLPHLAQSFTFTGD